MKRLGATVVFLLAALAAVTSGQPETGAGVVAIRGATLLTVNQGTIPGGTIVLRDGSIAALGRGIPIPAGAEVIDAAGQFVSPGLIDCHSHIGADSINEAGTTVSSMTGIEDVFDPTDVDIYRDLAGGLTTANILHGSANPIGGKNFVIKLRWGRQRPEAFAFAGAPPGIKLALGENPKRPGGGAGREAVSPARFPATRMGVEYVIRDAFTRARTYQQAWQGYEERRATGEDVLPPRRDLQLEPLVDVLEGRRLVHAHSYRADEILMLLRVAEEFGFKIATLQHALEGYKVAREIADHGAGASTFADWWGYKLEATDAIPYNAAIMARKGVLVSINSDSSEHARRLNVEAAKTIKWGGLTEEQALALITINPARQLRIDGRVGSLEVGKDADVVIWSHHPLSSYAVADRVYIDGVKYYDRAEDAVRVAEVARRKQQLREAERPPAPELPADTSTSTTGAAEAADAAAEPAPAERERATRANGVLAITNGKIFPITGSAIERGTVVIRNGIIDAIGGSVTAPAGATVIDAAGAEVYPGFIDARTSLGLSEPGAAGFGDVDDILDFNPQLRAYTAFHNDSDAIPIARANGVTSAAITPGGGILGGQIAVMNLDGFTWEESTLAPSVGVSFQFPGLPVRAPNAPGQPRSYSDLLRTRNERLDRLVRQLDDARAYAKAGKGRAPDLVLEALLPVISRRRPFFTRADTERDIRDAVAFADRANVKIVISGGAEAQMVAPLLVERQIPVILGSVLSLPSREDLPHQASYAAAGELVRAGVTIAFAAGDSDEVQNVRLLPYHAARSVAWGLAREAALKALTIDAARILGIADQVGSLETGKLANVIVSNGDPLDARTTIAHVVVAGHEVDLDTRQQALYARYMRRP